VNLINTTGFVLATAGYGAGGMRGLPRIAGGLVLMCAGRGGTRPGACDRNAARTCARHWRSAGKVRR
jgi:hypothetical protein